MTENLIEKIEKLKEELRELEKELDSCFRIEGSEIDFNFVTDDEGILKEKARDIWENPKKYSDYEKESEDAYYEFLKYLWIVFPNGEEEKLGDYVVRIYG